MRFHRWLSATLLLASAPGVMAQDPDPGGRLSLMTFNIRYGTAEDGPNAWGNRRDLVAGIIAREAPDVLALQEALAFQLLELEGALSEYRKLGQHRNGGLEGEFSGLFVRERRVRVRDWGEFWLSSSPDSLGSVGWDAALPRMAVWADLEGIHGEALVRVYGTHFDHRGELARLESARLIERHAEGGPPAVVMGDLNAGEGSGPLRVFREMGYRSAFPTLHPGSDLGTFNGFRELSGGERIDHILVDARLEVLHAAILDEAPGGVFPSDHYPVVAVIRTLRK